MARAKKATAEERHEARVNLHAARIRSVIGGSGGQKVDVSSLRQRADQMQEDFGDSALHDALDLTEREVIRHNRAVHKASTGGSAGLPRTMQEAQERAAETRRRTQQALREASERDREREAARGPQVPTSANHANRLDYGDLHARPDLPRFGG